MNEARLFLVGGAVAFVGFGASVLLGPAWPAILLLIAGLAAIGGGFALRQRRLETLRVEIEDEHLHPIPVLDAPKGTFDLIAGMAVKVDNRLDEPVGVRIDTLLYERTALKWDRPLSDARAVELLAPSVVPGRSVKSFFVRNYTRIPAEVDVLTQSHFVKLLVESSAYGKSVHRVFLAERFELPREAPREAPSAGHATEGAPLLPFSGLDRQGTSRARSSTERLGHLLKLLRPRESSEGDVKIHRLRKTDDTLEGLIDEIEAELDDGRA